MKESQAIRLAIEALEKEVQRLAVDANLRDLYDLRSPHAISASRKRKQLLAALELLREKLCTP